MDNPSANCPMLLLLDQLADKWTVRVMGTLCEQPLRFNELRRQVGGISQKMLSQTMRSLVRDGLVLRAVIPTSPITVTYSVTPLGRTLADAVQPLRTWSERHVQDVLTARLNHDASASPSRSEYA